MSITLKTVDFQLAKNELMREIEKFRGGKSVTVGIHEGAPAVEGTTEINMATLGAVLNFGATINHPGGTAYGYKSKEGAERGETRFLKSGTGYVTGVTQAHVIEIPARPWLAPGVESGTQEYIAEIANAVKNGSTLDQTLEIIGNIAVGKVQEFMTELDSPPNAPSTIAQKGSDNPLIADGHLRAAVTYAVTSDKLEEGLS